MKETMKMSNEQEAKRHRGLIVKQGEEIDAWCLGSYADRCRRAEKQHRSDTEAPSGCFVEPQFAEPQTPAEEEALETVLEFNLHAVTVSVYDVVNLLALEIQKRLNSHQAS